jgi:hypothetical protein
MEEFRWKEKYFKDERPDGPTSGDIYIYIYIYIYINALVATMSNIAV